MSERLFELGRRTFDTPAFRGIEFIEVESKSIINHVPGQNLPFEWTINAYRGCSHACSYCMVGDTPVLMADGRTKPLADIRVGDRVYGTRVIGSYRRLVPTDVRAHWSTTKRAYRVSLDDGTQLVASGDHRFLTNRGWRFVIGSEQGRDRRPHLTRNNHLLGFGRTAGAPVHDEDYRTGYLCGLVRGDGHVGSHIYRRRAKPAMVHRFRLAVVDVEALHRAREYLTARDVVTQEFDFLQAMANHRGMRAIRTSTAAGVSRVSEIVAWPTNPSVQWQKGFLAGIFDAEGSYSRGILRICNSDPEVIDHVTKALTAFVFDYVLEARRLEPSRRPLTVVRVRRGIREHLRFFHLTDPAITRKRTIDGAAIKNTPPLTVESVTDTGIDMPMFDITTGSGDFIANGVVSHNCFARATHTYLDMNAGRDFETKIIVKVNAPQLLRKELRAKRWKGDSIAMGTATDPYQRAEGRYKLTRAIVETLVEYGNPFSILTKGTLILRDLDLLTEGASSTDVSTAMSIPTIDEDVWRASEPGTPHPRKRLDAVRKLNDNGIPCGVMVAPILPGISDGEAQLRDVVEAALNAGASFVSPILLHLRPKVKDVYMEWLSSHYPDLLPRYRALYPGTYAPNGERSALSSRIRELVDAAPQSHRPAPRVRRSRAARVESAQPEQLRLI